MDPFCDPKNPLRIQFADISTAAFSIRDGVVRTPTVVGLYLITLRGCHQVVPKATDPKQFIKH